MSITIKQPSDPYSKDWNDYWAANPGLHRGVGSDGVNDDPAPSDDPKPSEDPADDPKPSEDPAPTPRSEPKDGDKTAEEKAALLKEVMQKKTTIKAKEDEIKTLNEKLAKFSGIDLDEIQTLLNEKKTAEQRKLEEKGEWDKLKSQIVEQHQEELRQAKEEAKQLRDELNGRDSTINELTVGHSFDSSGFIKNDMHLTASKARIVYGSHFEIQDGKVVAFDGTGKDRTMLVDGSGEPLGFEDAIKKIVDADPDRDYVLKSKVKPGSDSKPNDDKAPTPKPELKGASKIAAALNGK